MRRRVLTVLFAAQFFFGALAHGQAFPDVERVGLKYGTDRVRTNQVRAIFDHGATRFIVDQGQTLVIIFALATMIGTRAVMEESARLSMTAKANEPAFGAHFLSISTAVAAHVLTNTELAAGLCGATATTGACHRPLALIQQLAQESRFRPLLRNLISHLATFAAVSLGFDFFRVLLTEATEMFDNEEDLKIARHWPKLLRGLLTAPSGGELSQRERRVLSQLMGNLYAILIERPDLRSLFLSHYLHQSILTGEFITLIATTAAATAAGSTIFPGAGSIAGAIFGLTGGVAWIFIPDQTKDSITHGIQSLRRSWYRWNYPRYRPVVQRLAHRIDSDQRNLTPIPLPTISPLEADVSVSIDRMAKITRRLTELRQIARNQNNRDDVRLRAREEHASVRRWLLKECHKVVTAYQLVDQEINEAVRDFNLAVRWEQEDLIDSFPDITTLRQQARAHRLVGVWFQKLEASMASGSEIDSESNSYVAAILRLHTFGFSEKLLLKSLN